MVMMTRAGLLLLAGALAVAASNIFDHESSSRYAETVFRPGVEYTYKYDSQVLTGIPNGGNQYAGLKLKCTVRVYTKSASLVLMKLEDIKICEVNTDIRTSLPSELISEEFCSPSSSEHIRVMTTELHKPISFKYESGLVSRLETDISDPFWSVNIKRGILNLFQLSLNQEREVTEFSSDESTEEYSLRNVIMKDRTVDKLYRVKESGVVGDCETVYAIYDKTPSVSESSDSFFVTKVKDFKKCSNKVVYEQGLFAGHTSWLWLPHDERKPLVLPVTHAEYELTGNRKNFLIRTAKLHSEYIFTPFSEEGGSMVTYIKLHLKLTGTTTPSSPIVVGPKPIVHKHALLLHVPHTLAKLSKGAYNPETSYPELNKWTKDTPYSADSESYNGRSSFDESRPESAWDSEYPGSSSGKSFGDTEEGEEEWDETSFSKWESNKFDWTRDSTSTSSNLDKVRTMLRDILSTMTPYVTEETPKKLIHLKRVLETCTPDELWTIVNEVCSRTYSNDREYTRAKEIILDLLPVVPKPIVPEIIKSLVTKNIIFPKRAAYMISLYSLMAPGRPRIVKSMLKVCKEPIMTNTDEQLFRTCVLGLGTVTHKLFAMHIKTKVSKTVSFTIISEVVREMKKMLTSSDYNTKVLALKAIGNTGLPEFIPELHRVIREKSGHLLLRKLAVYALRRVTILAPYEVSKIVLPVFMDARETSEMRIASFLICMYTKPRTSTVLLMANRLRHDPSLNLKSFVYSYLSTLSQSVLPTSYHTAKSAKLAMLSMKPYDFGFSYSKGYHFDMISEKFDMGAMLESFLIHSPSSALPKGFVAKFGAVFAHTPLYLFETGAEIKGIDTIISKLFHHARPMFSKLSKIDWSRVMTPEWYKEVYPEVSSWMSSRNWDVRDMLKSYESSTGSFEKTNWGSVEETIRDVLGKIKFEDRNFEMPELLTYFKILSNQVTFFNIDRKFISELISSSEWISSMMSSFSSGSSNIPVDVVKSLPLIDNCYIIPTPIGMPLHLNFSAVAITKVTGHITPVSIPSIRELFLARSIPEDIKVAVDLKPSFAVKMVCEMGVHLNVLKATTLVKGYISGHAPIKSEVSFSMREKKLKLNWEIPQESFTPLKVAMKVVTRIFKLPIRHYEIMDPSFIVDKDVVHPTVLKSIPVSVSPVATVFGVHAQVTSEMFARRTSWAPFYPLCGRFHFRVACTPTEDRPKIGEFKMILGSSYSNEYVPSSSSERSERQSSEEWDVLEPLFPVRKNYRTSVRDEFETDFSAITPFSEISNPRSRHISFIFRTLGGTRTRFVQTHMTWIHSRNYLVHQFNCQITGTPIVSWYSTPIKMTFDSAINLKTLIAPYTSSDNFVAKMDVYYGDKSFTDSTFSVKVMSGRTGMSWESDYSPLSRHSWYSSSASSATDKYEYYCTMTYKQLPTTIENQLVQGFEMFKVLTYPYLYVKKTGLNSESNKVTAYIKIIPTYKKFTAIINTPTETDIMIDVPTFNPLFSRETVSLSVPAPLLMSEGFVPSSVFEPEEFEYTKTSRFSFLKSWTGQCTVTESRVKTFDDVSFTLPEMPSMCEMIIARDCSSMGSWLVTMTPMSTMSATMTSAKIVRMIVPHYEFKIKPSSSMSYGAIVFYVNGEMKEITPGQSLMFPDTSMSSSSDVAYMITMEGDMIKIECSKLGIVIMTNGKYIMIQSTSMYRGRTCGLCGNFDGKKSDEYEGPSKTIYESPEHFVVKYTLPSSECSVRDLMTKYKVADYTFSGECVHEMRNIPKVTHHRGEKKVCFTVKPEPVCGEGCKRISPRPKYTAFHCLPANDITTQNLVRESRIRVLSELAWKPVDIYDYVDTQDKCVAL